MVGDLTIELHRRYPPPRGDTQRQGIDTSTFTASYFTVTSETPRSIAEWDESATMLQDLLTLATDSPCAVLRETLTLAADQRDDGIAIPHESIGLYRQHVVTADPEAPSIEPRTALFTLGTAGVEYDSIIPKWVEVNQKFKVACDMILGLHYVKGGYLQTDLITAVGAAEAVHEGLGFDPPIKQSEFKKLKKALIAQVPVEHQQWLREKLGRNTRTLRTKLLDLAGTAYPDVMATLLPNPDAWAHATKKERDPVAHGGDKMSGDIELLNAIVKVTTAVVVLNLLHQLAIPEDRLTFAVVDSPTLATAARVARKYWS